MTTQQRFAISLAARVYRVDLELDAASALKRAVAVVMAGGRVEYDETLGWVTRLG